MTPMLRQGAAFLLGAGLVMGPALALLPRRTAPPPPVSLHDFFPPPHLADDHRFRLVAFGSSSTHGYGASSPAATYPAQLQRLFEAADATRGHVDVVNRGIDGEDVRSMLERLDDDILPRHPDLIVWQLGSNDALRGISPADFATRLRDGIARIAAAGVPLVLVGPQWNPDPNRAALFARMNNEMLTASRDNGLVMINRLALMQRWLHAGGLDERAMIGADGLHMSDQGYALLARAVYEAVAARIPAAKTSRIGLAD